MRPELVLKWIVIFCAPFSGLYPWFIFSDYIVCVVSVVLVYKFIKFLFFLANRIVSLSHRLTA